MLEYIFRAIHADDEFVNSLNERHRSPAHGKNNYLLSIRRDVLLGFSKLQFELALLVWGSTESTNKVNQIEKGKSRDNVSRKWINRRGTAEANSTTLAATQKIAKNIYFINVELELTCQWNRLNLRHLADLEKNYCRKMCSNFTARRPNWQLY